MTDKVVYLHIRNDNNMPFYVGIGSIKRAYSKNGRSEWWKRIYNIASRTVHILHNGLTNKEAKELEIQTIKKLKEKNFELCNLTNGGDGRLGSKQPKSFSIKRSAFLKGNNYSLGKPFKDNIVGISMTNDEIIKFNGSASIKADKRFDLRSVYRCANKDIISKNFAKGIHRGFQFFWEYEYLRKVGK